MTEEEVAEEPSTPSTLIAPYRLIGDRLTRVLPFFEDLKVNLLKANLKIAFPVYVAYMLFFSTVAFTAVFAVASISTLLYGLTASLSLLLGLALGLLAWALTFAALYAYPSMLADTRKRHLEEELPYLASHMAVLSQAGMTPERIFRSISMTGSKGFRSVAAEEARNVVRDIHLLGFDVVTAMERSSGRSPSKRFSDFINGLIAVTKSGGDMTKYFMSAARGFMDSARIAARQLADTLGTIAELYVAMMVVFPLVVVIMLAVMGIIGGSIAGLSITTVMYLVAYFILPVLAMILLLLLDSLMPPR